MVLYACGCTRGAINQLQQLSLYQHRPSWPPEGIMCLSQRGVGRQSYAVVVKIQDRGFVMLFFPMLMVSFVMLMVRFAVLMF